MPCLAALIILSVLGIFSASHRKLAKEAFQCVFRRVTLKPCDTGFDVKVKATIIGKVLKKSPKAAQVIGKNFELISWVLIILMSVSSIYTIKGLYNFYAWGHCDGPDSSGFCVFDPTQSTAGMTAIKQECSLEENSSSKVRADSIDEQNYLSINEESDQEMWFVGCFGCKFSREMYPKLYEMAKVKKLDFRYMNFPVHENVEYLDAYDYCVAETDEDKYYDFVQRLFEAEVEVIADESQVGMILDELGVDSEALNVCLNDESLAQALKARRDKIEQTGIYGTPTVFINETAVVGPKPMRVYERLIRGGWF